MKNNFDLSKYKYFFVNGCSFTEGGGLEEPNIRSDDGCRPTYEKVYNVTWNTREDVNWGKRLSEIIGIPCINHAKCGAGTEYVVRTTYNFIFKHWEDRHKFFIILEKPSPSRFEVFDNKTKEYYIVNTDDNGFVYATREYWSLKNKEDDPDEIQQKFKLYYDNHCDEEQNLLENDKHFLGLYSFCKLHNIKIILTEDVSINIGKNEIIDKDDFYKHIFDWSIENKITIADDCYIHNELITDIHPGYFAHIKYAQELAKYLGWKSKMDVNIKNNKIKWKYL